MIRKIVSGLVALVILSTSTTAPAAGSGCNDGKDRHVTVINDTRYSILQLYGSSIGTDDWEEDVLGSKVLGPGETVRVNFDDGTCYCTFDFKAVFNDGTSTVNRRYNVCESSTWRIHE